MGTATTGNKNLQADFNDAVVAISAARTKWGLAAYTNAEVAVSGIIKQTTLADMKTKLDEAKTTSGSPADTSPLVSVQFDFLRASLVENFKSIASTIQNYCSCNCNNCSCNCDRCSCDCNQCTCVSQCTCDCNACSCLYCGCEYEACTGNSRGCGCDGYSGCPSDGSCGCNCNY